MQQIHPHPLDPNGSPHPAEAHVRPVATRVRTVDRQRSRWLWFAAFIALVTLALMATRVSAQQAKYDSIPMHPRLEDEQVLKSVQAATKQFAMTGQGNANLARGYFTVYVPAKMTAPDGVKYISDLMKEASSLLTRAQRGGRTQVASALTGYIFQGMKKVAEGNHHPAARINATIMLSRLDSRPMDQANRRPPVPLIQTLPILINLYQDTQAPDGVRAAALHGIHRHVLYGFPQINAQDRATIQTAMNDLLNSDPPEGRPADAHAYLQRFAVDVLDTFRAKNDTNLGKQLVSISTEDTKPALIALYSAARLGPMGQEMQGQINEPEKVLHSWSKRVLEAFQGELDRIHALDRPEPVPDQPVNPESFIEVRKKDEAPTARRSMDEEGGYEMDMDMGGMESDMEGMMDDMEMDMSGMDMDMMMSMGGSQPEANPQPPEVIAARRMINYALAQIHLGVTGSPTAGMPSRNPGGLLASVPAEKRAVIQQWVEEMQPIIEAINDKTLDDREKFVEGLTEQIEALKAIVGEDEAAQPELPDELQPVAPDPADDPDPLAAVDPLAN